MVLIMHKSDVAGAYCNIPMSPMWQLKQIVAHRDSKHVDQSNYFGCRGSYYIYLAFISLVCWIAERVKGIKHLKCYIDDNCSFACIGNVKYYSPYGKYFPTDQTKLLELWDEIGLPHEDRKQVYGPIVPFIRFNVDPNRMSISISNEQHKTLIQQVVDFAKPGKCQTLKDFQSLAGHVNWSLAVFPLLKPGLSAVYAKMVDKTRLLGPIRVNNTIQDELLWFVKHAEQSDGIFLLKTVAWDPMSDLQDATVCHADACPCGMGFWFPEFNLGFQCLIPEDENTEFIFYYEAITVSCCMLNKLAQAKPRLVVYSDNMNTVNIWHSLKASSPYNNLLIIRINSLIEHQIDAQVLHIPGDVNLVADALSHFNNEHALQLCPGLHITTFTPPQGMLGACQK
jgi:hypothetical protein